MQLRHACAKTAVLSLLMLALSPALSAREEVPPVGRSLAQACTRHVSMPARAAGPAQPPGGFRFPEPANVPAEVTRLEQVAEGVYAVINVNDAVVPDIPLYGGNVTIILTPAGVVLVDAKTERMHDELMSKVRSVTAAPLEYVVLTHNHADHSEGAARLQALGATLITSATEAGRMAAGAGAVPQIGYAGQAQILLGGTRIELIEVCGHTSADTVVWLPDSRVVIAGDLVSTPDAIPQITNYADGGSWTDMVLALDALATLDFDVMVAGHGPVLSRQQFLEHRARITAIRQRAQALVAAGSTDAQIAEALATEFNWGGPGPAAANVAGMQEEFRPTSGQP